MSDSQPKALTGSGHYEEGTRLLSDASFVDAYGNPVTPAGRLMSPGEHAALVGRAQAHFAAAQAAAAALQTVTHYVGDSDEITAWARITGLLPARTDSVSRPCEFENHRSCAGCGCSCHTRAHTCVPFSPEALRRKECAVCRDECTQCRPDTEAAHG